MEIDHIFLCVKPGAPEADELIKLGLIEGVPNTHPGQGTANRRFFFRNFFIELLYLTDEREARSELTRPTQLYERLSAQDGTVSPLGICFRPGQGEAREVPFHSWGYRPRYLPEGLQVDVGMAPITEPMWFYLSFASRPDRAAAERRQPLEHAVGFKEVTTLKVCMPADDYSNPATQASTVEGFEIAKAQEHRVEIAFDNGSSGKCRDFRPVLPLVFKW
ncbi:hypothetical protein GCM10011352_10650 [Marinobacterium zhoushanense]|uniref:Glyoxalase-like domain-containing protein n=1 Tax=Marinobacterium zhoushanense TaxID=1679163 RepID=A0ABQ1K359_9GAMM|nr:VOC family protein [Marinobacterium zhoushanense]GGB86621.1 hypothetical protein GCM10011352_10650 [Marinobacterium zhoushanense]